MILKIYKTQVSKVRETKEPEVQTIPSFNHQDKHGRHLKKFTSQEKLGITCMQVSSKGVASTLVFASLLEDKQRLIVGVLLMVLKSEIKPSTPASFYNFQTPKVVIGLISNHFHEFW